MKLESMPDEELRKVIKKSMTKRLAPIRPIPYIGGIDQLISYSYEELTAQCPMTGIQDLYKLTISFIPDSYIPELKSLRFYLLGYRDLRISHEHLHARIFRDFKEAVKPKQLKVSLDVAVRGGIHTVINYEERK